MITRYIVSEDKFVEAVQDDFDLLEYKLQLIGRIMRQIKVDDLKSICRFINSNKL